MSVCAYQPRGALLGPAADYGDSELDRDLAAVGSLMCGWWWIELANSRRRYTLCVAHAGGAPLGMAACWVGAWWCMLLGCESSVACTTRSWVLCMAISQSRAGQQGVAVEGIKWLGICCSCRVS